MPPEAYSHTLCDKNGLKTLDGKQPYNMLIVRLFTATLKSNIICYKPLFVCRVFENFGINLGVTTIVDVHSCLDCINSAGNKNVFICQTASKLYCENCLSYFKAFTNSNGFWV